MAVREVVLNRDEFVEYLAQHVSDKNKMGRILSDVESAFIFQNDVGRPAYLLEVDPDIDQEAINYLHECFSQMTVCACLVPRGTVSYAGTVTPDSIGVRNVKTELFNRQPVEWDDFPVAEESE